MAGLYLGGSALLNSAAISQTAQEETPSSAQVTTTPSAEVDKKDPAANDKKGPGDPVEQERTTLNLLGQTNSSRGESRRNENVQFNPVDNNALKELNVRLGPTATIVDDFRVDRDYFGAEFGGRTAPPVHASPAQGSGVHGSFFASHNNSIFSARSFFQVGDVKPARENFYGGNFTAPLWRGTHLSMNGSQNKIRGSVNGNILVLLPGERTPLTDNPGLRAIVEKYINAYPDVPPNRPDIADRALNISSPQRIDTHAGGVQLDQSLGNRGLLTFRYNFTYQNIDSFQFVSGQNPDADTRSHSARVTWNRSWSPATITDLTVGFDRLTSLLLPAEGAVGPIRVGRAITGLGPKPFIPINRIQNRSRYAGTVQHNHGDHLVTGGFSLARLQYNGIENDGHRGILNFGNDFGRDAITNLRLGTPSSLIQALGTTYRGFRSWEGKFYIGDKWRATSNLTLSLGLRYIVTTRPHDVTGRGNLPFKSDLNNFSPSFGFAYRLLPRWGVVRGAYGLHYGQIFPVTYGHSRLNAPHSLRVVIPTPDLTDPLGGISFEDLDPTGRVSLIDISPNLRIPYSQQYNFSWESELAADWRLQLGYAGSRSNQLFQTWFLNRAQPVTGIPLTSRTVNERRSNQDMFEHLLIHNASRGYYDAARVSLIAPRWRILSLNASYWFSKAIDLGTDYTNTASPEDARVSGAQTESDVFRDLKALSNFDQPHAFLLQATYEIPLLASRRKWMRTLFGAWNISAVALIKSGTPFTVDAGSDAPGFGNVDGDGGDRPNVLNPSILGRTIGHPDTSSRLLPRADFAFIQAPDELAGNLGRNTFRKGKIANVNAALGKSWAISGDRQIRFRAESVNLLNTPQFAEPTASLTSPSFAQINNTLNDGRAFRFTLRFDF